MTDQDQQANAEAVEDEGTGKTESTDSGKDALAQLDHLLAKYSEDDGEDEDGLTQGEDSKRTPAETDAQLDRLETLLQRGEERDARDRDREVDGFINDEVASLKGEFEELEGVADHVVRDHIEGEARRAKGNSLNRAFFDRHNNPAAWKKVRTALGEKLVKNIGVVADSTAEEKAARSAGRGIRSSDNRGNAPLSQEEYDKMSETDWEQHIARRKAGA